MMRPLLLMTLCHISPILPFSRVLILRLPPWAYRDSLSIFLDFMSLYLAYFSLAQHSYWEMCILYALVTNAPTSFPFLFICFLVEVYRSSSTAHGLFFPIFIHRILLHLGLDDFPTSEPVHIITPIGVTFLRQRAAQMKASSKHPRVESSTGVAS